MITSVFLFILSLDGSVIRLALSYKDVFVHRFHFAPWTIRGIHRTLNAL